MKKLVLSAMLGLLVIGTAVPISASASEDWGCSLNPAKVYRQNEENNYGWDTTSLSYSKGDAWVSHDYGPEAIYARAKNSSGSWRSASTYIDLGDWEYLDSQTMSPGYDYYLWCKNSVATTNWVWASGTYDWE